MTKDNRNKSNCRGQETLCSKEICMAKGGKCDYLDKQYGLKRWVFTLIVITIVLGAIVPFATETIGSIYFPSAVVGLNTWNQFVSIILGITATILSIVSMIMSFKNYDDTLAIQEKYTSSLDKLTVLTEDVKEIAKELRGVKSDVNYICKMGINYDLNKSTPQNIQKQWEQEPLDIEKINTENHSI